MHFVHLHVHTQYSLLKGTCNIDELIKTAKFHGQKSIAITDYGTLHGIIEFYHKACLNNIKPIIGCEIIINDNLNNNNLILLCENNIGYKNLIYIVSNSYIQNGSIKSEVDYKFLKKYSNGIICIISCFSGQLCSYLLNDDYINFKRKILDYKNIFNNNSFYLEMQNHGLVEENKINYYINKISKELFIPIVITNNVHFVNKQDFQKQKLLLYIKNEKNNYQPIKHYSNEFYLKSSEEMLNIFKNYPIEFLNNTNIISNRCNITINNNYKNIFPTIIINRKKSSEYLTELCWQKLKTYITTEKYVKRLDYELNIIIKMSLSDYFLVIYDIILFAKKNNIMIGPGRGSIAGSLVAYLLNITNIDPIKFSLYFERFLNIERNNLPDIDIDFCYERRIEIINYIKEKYGKNNVSQIITFGKLTINSAIRDIAKIMNYSQNEINDLIKKFKIDKNLDQQNIIQKLININFKNVKLKKIIINAIQINGMLRNISTHASGIVITNSNVEKYLPITKNNDIIITQFTSDILNKLNVLKFDFLGLKTITIISNTIKSINKKTKSFNINNIHFNDSKIFNMLSFGNTLGVFQLESYGITKLTKQIKPVNIEDIISIISLYRPGTIQYINFFLNVRNNKQSIVYKHEILESILKNTCGCILYQEQVMEIFEKIAGYSLKQADIFRDAISKKKYDVIYNEYNNFLYGNIALKIKGAINIVYDKFIAEKIFKEITKFSKYAFNKSHASSYAIITYQTAYLKYYYPTEFMASLLTSTLDNTNKLIEYIFHCKQIKIKILRPEINLSYDFFSIENTNIRFPINGIKNIGKKIVQDICLERKINGLFLSVNDFYKRMLKYKLNNIILKKLILSNVFYKFGTKEYLLNDYEKISTNIFLSSNKLIKGQINFLI